MEPTLNMNIDSIGLPLEAVAAALALSVLLAALTAARIFAAVAFEKCVRR